MTTKQTQQFFKDMPELTTAAAVTLAAGSIAVPALTLFGVPLGLRPEILIAGFDAEWKNS